MATWLIEPLAKRHDRTVFDCGKPLLTDWLRKRATQDARRGLSRTYVAVRPGQSQVLGYYSIASHHVMYAVLPDDEAGDVPPGWPVPVVLLGRLATDRSVQGQGLGKSLLIDALRRVLFLADQLGIRAVEVDALDDPARDFYLHFGFQPLLDDPRHLFLALKVARQLGLAPLDG